MFSNKQNAQSAESNASGKPNKTRRRVWTVVGAVGIGLGAIVAANAFMTISSTGDAPGHTGKIVNPTFTGAVVDDLYQGYCNDVKLTITNPNKVGVTIASLDELGFKSSTKGDFRPGGNNTVESLLQQEDVKSANDTQFAAGETKTVTLPNAVCFLNDSRNNDNQFQDQDFDPLYRVNFTQIAGAEAPSVSSH